MWGDRTIDFVLCLVMLGMFSQDMIVTIGSARTLTRVSDTKKVSIFYGMAVVDEKGGPTWGLGGIDFKSGPSDTRR
jgi:hypothetical protein